MDISTIVFLILACGCFLYFAVNYKWYENYYEYKGIVIEKNVVINRINNEQTFKTSIKLDDGKIEIIKGEDFYMKSPRHRSFRFYSIDYCSLFGRVLEEKFTVEKPAAIKD